jgi:hypothetical protein
MSSGSSAASVGGNGTQFSAGASFSFNNSVDTTGFFQAEVTTPDGEEVDSADITGTGGFTHDASSGGSVSQSLSYDSQTSSGDLFIGSDEFNYFSLSVSSSSTGSSSLSVADTFPLEDPAPGTTPGSGLEFSVNNAGDSDGSALLSLSVQERTSGTPGNDSVEAWSVSFSSGGLSSDSASLDQTPGGEPEFSADNKTNRSFTTSYSLVENYLITSDDPLGPTGYGTNVAGEVTSYHVFSDSALSVSVTATGDPVITAAGEYETIVGVRGDQADVNYVEIVDSNGTVTWSSDYGITANWGSDYELTGGTAEGELKGEARSWSRGFTWLKETGTYPSPIPPKDSWTETLDYLQLGLDGAGMIPGVGIFADAVNVGMHLGRGQFVEAATSGLAMAPGFGQGVTAAKLAGKALKAGAKHGDELVDAGKVIGKLNKKVPTGSNCFVAGTQVVVAEAAVNREPRAGLPKVATVSDISVSPTTDDESTSVALVGMGAVLALIRRNMRMSRRRNRHRVRQPLMVPFE